MSDKSLARKLSKDAKSREEMFDEAIKSLQSINKRKEKEEKTIHQYKIDEIKYKTTINELNDYIEIYKKKLDSLEEQTKKDEKELMTLRKKVLKNDTDLTTLKSILELFVKEYGIDQVGSLTKLEKSKIKSYIEGEK